MRTVLVAGFGPFPGVERNPAAEVARAVDGRRREGWRAVGRVLPVSYARGPQQTVDAAREVGACLVLGLGVAPSSRRIAVERQAVRAWGDRPDVDGCCEAGLEGPERQPATLDCARLASALGAGLSHDAGRYVCNAWLYRVSAALDVPVGFVHLPPEGVDPDRLLYGIGALLAEGG